VPELRQKGQPAKWIDGGRRRWPLRLGGNDKEGVGLDNTRTGEAHWGLVKLLGWLAGGERERTHELKAAAAMARWSSGWRTEGFK
jgi:hypothetical protein